MARKDSIGVGVLLDAHSSSEFLMRLRDSSMNGTLEKQFILDKVSLQSVSNKVEAFEAISFISKILYEV